MVTRRSGRLVRLGQLVLNLVLLMLLLLPLLTCATTHVMNLSPVVNLAREPRWGRNIETAGEDPYHLGQYAEAFVKGMQVYDDDPEHIMAGACCKHYVANS